MSLILRTYKAAVTTACRRAAHTEFAWQRNYYEHIIRDERALYAIRRYILNNPLKWVLDRDNLQNPRRLRPPETIADYLDDLAAPE